MKTAATVLQEIMVKLNQTPEYKCISQTGPQHLASFEFECQALGVTVNATAHSKKEAKQEVARQMLLELAVLGHDVPEPYGLQQSSRDSKKIPGAAPLDVDLRQDSRSYVALLKELCVEYRLPLAEYSLVGDTGPAHMRRFTVRAQLGAHARVAAATTKKTARQLAAHQLYCYLRENLAQIVSDYGETGGDALVSAADKAFEKYMEVRQETIWRPDLGQKMSLCHSSVFAHIDTEKSRAIRRAISSLERPEHERRVAFDALAEIKRAEDAQEAASKTASSTEQEEIILDYSHAEGALPTIAQSLGLRAKYDTLPSVKDHLYVAELTPTMPEIALIGCSKLEAATRALEFVQFALSSTEESIELDELMRPSATL